MPASLLGIQNSKEQGVGQGGSPMGLIRDMGSFAAAKPAKSKRHSRHCLGQRLVLFLSLILIFRMEKVWWTKVGAGFLLCFFCRLSGEVRIW